LVRDGWRCSGVVWLFGILRSGGTVGMANWTPTSFGKQLVEVAARYAPPPPSELPSPFG
jgi:hypothetical protein